MKNLAHPFASLAAVVLGLLPLNTLAIQTDITPPVGSNSFGATVAALPNGNIVVTDPDFDAPGLTGAGAIYLYSGAGVFISTLTGARAGDHAGSRVVVLTNGNFVVGSEHVQYNTATDAGAATWINGTTGLNGVISAANSLLGSRTNDRVGETILPLPNGNYVVNIPHWDGTIGAVGAVAWGSGVTGVKGFVSTANALVGSTQADQVGSGGVTILTNGNYVVSSPNWYRAPFSKVGAVTWGSGTAGVRGLVSNSNSLTGTQENDAVGLHVTALANGNYVVGSPNWKNGTRANSGAATWGSGTAAGVGMVSSSNSLIGSTAGDMVGESVVPLPNGGFLVVSPKWQNGPFFQVGAVTWDNGSTGTLGAITPANSLVGVWPNDMVGSGGVTVLSNGNYVISSPLWNNGGITDAGAATWGSAGSGVTGVISSSNSLVGGRDNDRVSSGGITALKGNGNYVVASPNWGNGVATQVGAVTWCRGTEAAAGGLGSVNSLIGTFASNQVGSGGVVALPNGNYVVLSPLWDNAGAADLGAVTWGSGVGGVKGAVFNGNSLVGGSLNDKVGSGGVTPLTNGNFVVSSPLWNLPGGGAADVGAVTWGLGTKPLTGAVTGGNSLVGSTASDQAGSDGITPLTDGNYLVRSSHWTHAGAANAGALTWVSGLIGAPGPITETNSLVGDAADDAVGELQPKTFAKGFYIAESPLWDGAGTDLGAVTLGPGGLGVFGAISSSNGVLGSSAAAGASAKMVSAFNQVWKILVVGQPAANRVTLFGLAPPVMVERPVGTSLSWNSSFDFGNALVGGNLSLTFKVTNTTGAPLAGLTATRDGPNAAEFTASGLPATLPAGGTAIVTIKFAPAKAGVRTANLHIDTTTLGHSPFNLVLTGTAFTPVFPIVKTLPADGVDFGVATLHGTVDAKNYPRDITFQYGVTTAYGAELAATPPSLSGSGAASVSLNLAGLLPHTKYHYRVRAAGFYGDAVGADLTFVTPDHAPLAGNDSYLILPGAKATLDVLANDSDADGDALTISSFTAVVPRTAGALARVGTALVFTASSTYSGAAAFDYTASDGFGKTATAHVTLELGSISIDPTTVTKPSAGVSYDITVTATGVWSAIETLPWLTLSKMGGVGSDTVTVTLQPNAAKADRGGVVKIGGVTHAITQKGVLQPSMDTPAPIPPAAVGAYYSLPIVTTNPPVIYAATKLPPGLAISNTTGIITGTPTKAGHYDVIIKASNAAGAAAQITFPIDVDGLPDGAVGVFQGLVQRDDVLNGNLGSRFELTTTPAGSYSGKIITGATTQPLAGKLTADAGNLDHPRLLLSIPRKTGGPLVLDLLFDAPNHNLNGTLSDGGAHHPGVTAWRNTWNAGHKATAYAILHTFSLTQGNANMAYPQGYGYGSFTPKEATGSLTLSGKLADGSPFNCAAFVGKDGQVLIYQPLYANKGTFAGIFTVTPGGTPADNAIPPTTGNAVTWAKPATPPATADTVYRGGFGPIELVAEGAAYVPPAKGAVVMGLPNLPNKANLDFASGGLDTEAAPLNKEFNITFSLLNPSSTGLTNKATFPANPNKVTLPTVTPATGAFSGDFTLPNVPAALNRKVPFQGLIVKHAGGTQGYGYFLMPELPDAPNETLANTPKHSGQVFLDAAP